MDCRLCGGSNREHYGKCPRCGSYDPAEMKELKDSRELLLKEKAAHADTKDALADASLKIEELSAAPEEPPKV